MLRPLRTLLRLLIISQPITAQRRPKEHPSADDNGKHADFFTMN